MHLGVFFYFLYLILFVILSSSDCTAHYYTISALQINFILHLEPVDYLVIGSPVSPVDRIQFWILWIKWVELFRGGHCAENDITTH